MIRRLLADRRGGVAIFIAGGLPLFLGCAAFAVDLGAIELGSRRLQGLADAAALSAAADTTRAASSAQAVVSAANWPGQVSVAASTGRYSGDLAVAPAQRFVAQPGGDAARVTLSTTMPTYFAGIFGIRNVVIRRTATAASERMASFSVGSRLAAVDGGILNGILSGLTGSSVSLSVMDYNALAGADVDLFGYLDALRTTANVGVGSYSDLLSTKVTASQALSALAAQLDSQNNGSAAAAVRKLAGGLAGQQISLGSLIDAGPMGGRGSGGAGLARVDSMALVTALLEGASAKRQLSLDLGATVPGLASSKLSLAIGERPNQSPWIAIGNSGTPIVRTAQTRLYLETRLSPTLLPGLGGLVSITLPVYLELAGAEARLGAIDCTAAGRSVTLEARPDPGVAAIATIDPSVLPDFTTPMPLGTARLVDTPLIDVDGGSRIDLGLAEPWQRVSFSQAQIDAGTTQTVSGRAPTSSIAASLVTNLSLTPRVLGLPIPLDPLLKAVGGALATVAPALDNVLNLVTGAVGVHVGQADVRVTGLRCGTPSLVA